MATRTHIVLPDELLAELDELIEPRRRSEFITEAVRDKVKNLRQIRALRETAGILRDEQIPGWETPESTSEWVRKNRQQDDERLDQMLARWSRS